MYVFLVASSVGTRAGVMCEGVEVGCDGKGLVDWYEPTERENKGWQHNLNHTSTHY